MASDRAVSLGLDTDTPPDRLQDRAFRTLNAMPGSATSVRPRYGTSKSSSYRTGILGRSIIIDGLPDNLGNGYLVVCTNETDAGAGDGTTNDQTDGLGIYKPSVIGSMFDTVDGKDRSTVLYGTIGSA